MILLTKLEAYRGGSRPVPNVHCNIISLYPTIAATCNQSVDSSFIGSLLWWLSRRLYEYHPLCRVPSRLFRYIVSWSLLSAVAVMHLTNTSLVSRNTLLDAVKNSPNRRSMCLDCLLAFKTLSVGTYIPLKQPSVNFLAGPKVPIVSYRGKLPWRSVSPSARELQYAFPFM
jgi:hypothetical protein